METHSALLHDIAELQGVGAALAKRMKTVGIKWCEQLLTLQPTAIQALGEDVTGLSYNALANSLIPQARFLRLPGIDGQLAEGLAASGYRHYVDLVMASTQLIAKDLDKRKEEGLIPKSTTKDVVQTWQVEAARRMVTGTILLQIRDTSTQRPIKDAKVRINGFGFTDDKAPIRRESSSDGYVLIELLRAGAYTHRITITAPGYKRRSSVASFHTSMATHTIIYLDKGQDDKADVDEFAGETMGILSGREITEFEQVTILDDLPGAPPFQVREYTSGDQTVKLVSLWRRLYGDLIWIPFVQVPRDQLPASINNGDVIERKSGKYTKLSESKAKALIDRHIRGGLAQLKGGKQ